jgi:hypothetical protein
MLLELLEIAFVMAVIFVAGFVVVEIDHSSP